MSPTHRALVRRMLGLDQCDTAYRNHYVAERDHTIFADMERLGLVVWQVRPTARFGGLWRVTRAAAANVLEPHQDAGGAWLYPSAQAVQEVTP